MTLIIADRVKEQTSTTGTGTLNLAGPVTQFQSFASAIGNGNTTLYSIQSGDGVGWETGLGTVTTGTPNTLSRDTVFESSNSGSHVNLSGVSSVFVCRPSNHGVTSSDLDFAFGNTRGSLLYRGASTWTTLTPNTAGYVLTDGGSGANPSWAANSGGGGGGGGSGLFGPLMSTLPTQSGTGFTNTANLSPATVTDAPNGILISQTSSNGNAENWRLIYKTAPSTPYTITALISLTSNFSYTNYAVAALGFYDGSTKFEYIGINIGSVNPSSPYGALQLADYNSVTSSSSSTIVGSPYPNPLWVQLANDGTAVHFRVSADGHAFYSIKDENISGGFLSSYSDIFFGANAYASPVYATLMSYAEA